jgi:SNF2 family DNA or RNA helicase
MELVKLWKHQQETVQNYKDRDYCALFFEPGTGKTRTAIEILRHKCASASKLFSTLILAPCIVLENWKEEFLKYSKIPEERILVLYGPTKKRIEQINAAKAKWHHRFIAITNYEAVATSSEFFTELFLWSPEVLISDESQKIKSFNSKRTKAVTRISDRAKIKFILTGTPILNTPMDIYSQYRVLDGGERFGKNFYIFRSTYFYDKNRGMPKDRYFPNWVIRPTTFEALNNKIYTCAVRVKKAECLDLPPLIEKKVVVELSSVQRGLYESMKNDYIAFLSDKACTAQLAITKGLRLMQITTGFIKFEDGLETSFEDTPRQKALEELLEEITPSAKVLVWCVFKENYEQVRKICKKLKLKYVEIHGEIKDKDRYENMAEFNDNKNVKVLIGHPGAGGVGVNLIAASYMIYFSRNFSLENDIQSEARNYRGGSEIHEKITRIDIVAKDTIDELVMEALKRKENIGEKILRDWKEKL